MATINLLGDIRDYIKSKKVPVVLENIVVHTLPNITINPEIRTVDTLVLDLTSGEKIFNVYLGLVSQNGRVAEVHLDRTPDLDQANRTYEGAAALLDRKNYELHVFPPNIIGFAERIQ